MEKFININQFNGNSYDKMLPDNTSLETKQMYGLNSSNSTDDVLAFIGKDFGNMYVWKKFYPQINMGEAINVTERIYDYREAKWSGMLQRGTSISVANGELVINNPQTFQTSTDQNAFKGYYVKFTGDYNIRSSGKIAGKIVFFPTSASFSITGTSYLDVTGYIVPTLTLSAEGYVITHDNVPPVEAGYTFVSNDQLGNKLQIEIGSYVGTGIYGQSNPNSLTFGFVPKVVFFAYNNPTIFPYLWGNGNFAHQSGSVAYFNNVVISGNTMSWYVAGGGDALGQLNQSGETYRYVAIS